MVTRRGFLLGLMASTALPAMPLLLDERRCTIGGVPELKLAGVDLRPGAINFADGQAFRFITTQAETTLHFPGMPGPMRFATIEDALNALIPGEEVRIRYDQERGLWSTIDAGLEHERLGLASVDSSIDVEGARLPEFLV
jgi:hypothetical protein